MVVRNEQKPRLEEPFGGFEEGERYALQSSKSGSIGQRED